jgi:hypothetical protein
MLVCISNVEKDATSFMRLCFGILTRASCLSYFCVQINVSASKFLHSTLKHSWISTTQRPGRAHGEELLQEVELRSNTADTNSPARLLPRSNDLGNRVLISRVVVLPRDAHILTYIVGADENAIALDSKTFVHKLNCSWSFNHGDQHRVAVQDVRISPPVRGSSTVSTCGITTAAAPASSSRLMFKGDLLGARMIGDTPT